MSDVIVEARAMADDLDDTVAAATMIYRLCAALEECRATRLSLIRSASSRAVSPSPEAPK